MYIPDNAGYTESDILDAFGLGTSESEETTPDPTDDTSGSAEGEENTTPDENTDSTESETKPEENGKPEAENTTPQQNQQNFNNKQNQAFARMRAENSQQSKLIKDMASVLGIDTRLPQDQLYNALQAATRNAIAQKNNMSPEILARLEQLEERDARLTQLETTQRIDNELRDLQTTFKLSNEDLNDYVQGLIQEGFDVNAPGASLKNTWIEKNFDKYVQAKVDAAVLAEQQRASKAGDASTPSGQRGQEKEDTKTEINSVSALSDWLDGLSK